MNNKTYFIIILFLCLGNLLHSQNVRDSIVKTSHFRLGYAYQAPGADLANRFGNNSNIEVAFGIKTKNNLYFGIRSNYLFGNKVSEPGLLSNLYNDEGTIVANDGELARLLIQERGYSISVEFGKVFNRIGPNPNCGILVKGGIGFIQHKIRLEHQFDEITQLEGEYLKGYDRLTNGWQLNQFVGYYHQGSKRRVNFYVGLEAMEGFTAGRRDYNFDTMTVDNSPRKDILYGLRAGWIIHLYGRSSGGEYYY